MKSVMLKTTFREIRNSLGRYMAILAIVALGVGFFAGLKLTKPSMTDTVEVYFEKLNFFDFQLLSTLGFDEEDVEYFSEQKNVETAAGGYSFDIICKSGDDENSFVVKTHTITEGINDLYLISGRMPAADNECVVDSTMFGDSYIGQKLILSDENKDTDLENFKFREYIIVGTVQSPAYIQFERGNTSLGTGQVRGFVYMQPDGFDCEAYTEMFIKFQQDFPLLSDEYETFIEDKEADWKLILKTAALRRAEDIREEAEDALAEAKEEFETEKAKGEKELADALEQLEKAKQQIEDGRQQLEDGKLEIEEGWKALTESEKELAEGEVTLNENEALLLENENKLNAGMLTWQENYQLVMEQKTQLRVAEAEINSQEMQLSYMEQQMQILDMLIEAVKAQIEPNEGQQNGTQQDGQEIQLPENELLNQLTARYDEYRQQLTDGRVQLDAAKQMVLNGWSGLDAAEQQLNIAWTEIVTGQMQISAGKTEISNARQDIADGRLQIAEAKRDLEDAERTIAEKEKELAEGTIDYEEGLKEYEDGVREFEEKIAEAEEELEDAERKIEDINDPDTYVLGRNTNVGYVCFENDSNIVENISDVFPVFFFLVAALVCITTMNRMIEEQRVQIGVLKGLGYDKTTIMFKYLFYSGSAALLGCIIGYIIGTILFPTVIWVCYGIMYDVTSLVYHFDWGMVMIALIVSMLCSMGTTLYCCYNELNEVPAQLMRPKAPQAGKRIFLEKITFIWNRLKFLQKVSIRNVFRYKKRFFMMIIGISGCTSLVVAGFGINDSVKGVTDQQYTEIITYDMSVTFSEDISEEMLEEFEEITHGKISDYGLVMEKSIDLHGQDAVKSVNLVVFEDPTVISKYMDLHTKAGDRVYYPEAGQVVLTDKVANTYGLGIGDTVTLSDENHTQMTATLSGINQNFVFSYAFLHADTYEEQFGTNAEYKTIYINILDEEIDQYLLSADIMKMDDVASVTINQDTRERFSAMMSSLDYIVMLVILCAAALAFIVLYNLTNINITERVREIATIKVLGFYKNETCSYVFRENLILTAVGSIVGLGLGKLLHAFVMQCLQVDIVSFDVRITGLSYLYSVLLTFLFAFCVNRMMRKKIEKISMTESLKSVD